ncbi:fibronectin type III domain-containing protein 7 [Colossoma macropomum]|uniref:fibronectin type III domain-containing protein 7 n=1 Tax=Colossoma macropomum TaxID=42526 RepID=UPI001864288C|nr:fibronectin type III domain-containing protein 7 [Colossoma macropomum]
MDLCGIKLWMFLLGIISQNAVQGSTLTISIYTVTSKSAVLRWSSFSGSSSYRVTAFLRNSVEPSVFSSFSQNTLIGSINSLSPNTAYTFQVEALDGSMTVLAQSSVDGFTAPDVPTIKTASSKQSQNMTVEFVEVPGATSYVIRAETSDGSFFSETSVLGSPGTVVGLQPYTDYTLSVISVNNAGRSQPSEFVQAKTVLAAPQMTSSSPSNSSIAVLWAPVPHAVLYSLSIIREGSFLQSRVNTTNTSVTIDSLEAGTNYCIKGNAWSPESVPGDDFTVCQITRPSTPQSVVLQTVSGMTTLSVSWASVHGADQYTVISSSGLNCTSSSSTCTLTPLSCGQIQYISVTAMNQAGPSLPSDPQQFITFPCPPQPLRVDEIAAGNCSVIWSAVSYVDYYTAFIKRDDGTEETCNSTGTSCNFNCHCGYSYIMSVFANNQAGSSPPGPVLNQTTLPCCPGNMSVSSLSWESVMISWMAVRGADVYETRAVDADGELVCNDTSPVCVLSDLTCNTRYSLLVAACNDPRGCNRTCSPQTYQTAPCMPEIVQVTQSNTSSINITWTSANSAANYTVSVIGSVGNPLTCQSGGTSCTVTGLPCGTSYRINAIASTAAGLSMPSYSVPFETAPCCPKNLSVLQVTQAMSNISWSAAQGAQSFIASLTSSRGHAQCHTTQTTCLMGCITCGTNYTVSLEAISSSGHTAECTYHGFSTSECCPSGIRLFRRANNTLRVQWRSSSPLSNYTAQVTGSTSSRACSPPQLGQNTCDVSDVTCGDVYSVVVAPVNPDGTVVQFCSSRMYSVFCSGSGVGMVLYRGRRSVD